MQPIHQSDSLGDSSGRIDSVAMLARARALKRATAAGESPRPLLGKNLALMCADESPAADLFRRAASGLGARVAFIRATLHESSLPEEILKTAGMLGRLYDGVECQGMAHHVVERLAAGAHIPIFAGVASSLHPSARFDAELGEADGQDNHFFVVQAMLVESVF